MISENSTADGVEKEIDGEPGDVERLGVVAEDGQSLIGDVDAFGELALGQDEMNEYGNVRDDVGTGNKDEDDGQLEVPVLLLVPLLLLRLVHVVDQMTGRLTSAHPGAGQLGHTGDDERVQYGDEDDWDHAEDHHLDDVEDGKGGFVFLLDGAEVVVVVEADEYGMVGSDCRRHYGEDDQTGGLGTPHVAQFLEADGQENCHSPFDREDQDDAGGIIGKQIGEVLEEDAHDGTPVDDIRFDPDEVPASHHGQSLGEKHTDQVQRVRDGQYEEVDVGRYGLHLLRREHEHVEDIADQSDDDESQRREEVDLQ